MEELPAALLDSVVDGDCPAVRAWWAGLAAADRALVAELCDERRVECFFGPEADAPTVRYGRFLAGDNAWRFRAWAADWREYLTEHPDVVLAANFRSRCFRDGDGSVCVLVDWSLTRFRGPELPPSEQWRTEARAAPAVGR